MKDKTVDISGEKSVLVLALKHETHTHTHTQACVFTYNTPSAHCGSGGFI